MTPLLTIAIDVLRLDQVTILLEAVAGLTVARTVVEALFAMLTEDGETVIPVTGVVTVTLRLADLPPVEAVIVAVPLPTAVTSPDAFTVATALLVLVQFVTGDDEEVGVIKTVVCDVVLTVIANVLGVKEILVIGFATVTVAVVVCPLALAVMIAGPFPFPITTAVDIPEGITVAIDVLLEDEVTVLFVASVGSTVAVKVPF